MGSPRDCPPPVGARPRPGPGHGPRAQTPYPSRVACIRGCAERRRHGPRCPARPGRPGPRIPAPAVRAVRVRRAHRGLDPAGCALNDRFLCGPCHAVPPPSVSAHRACLASSVPLFSAEVPCLVMFPAPVRDRPGAGPPSLHQCGNAFTPASPFLPVYPCPPPRDPLSLYCHWPVPYRWPDPGSSPAPSSPPAPILQLDLVIFRARVIPAP